MKTPDLTRSLRIYVLVLALWTFGLIVLGGTVTVTGSLALQHLHQKVAAVAGAMTVLLALWLWRAPVEPALKRAGWIGVVLVLLQGTLGSISAYFDIPTTAAVCHACLGQIFFAWIACTAWIANTSCYRGSPLITGEVQKLYRIAVATIGFVLLQLFAGAIYRHTGRAFHFHLIGAFLVVLHGLLVLKRTLKLSQTSRMMKILALSLNGEIALQVVLGVMTWQLLEPALRVAHQSVGALLLATALIIAVQSTRAKAL